MAFYGPDDTKASKVVAGILLKDDPDADADEVRKWSKGDVDLRYDEDTLGQIVEYLKSKKVKTVAMVQKILGCPHEEGQDYPEGGPCPMCPFWEGRDRWEGMAPEQ